MNPYPSLPEMQACGTGYHESTWSLGESVSVRLRSDNPEHLQRIGGLWPRIFCCEQRLGSGAPAGIELRFRFRDQPLPDQAVGQRLEAICCAPGLSIWKTPEGFHLESPSAFLALIPGSSRAHGSLDAAFWSLPIQGQRAFFTLAFLLLLNVHGFYGLHASATEASGSGFLLVGDSGCGKTTTTVALARSGWKYLSDDAVILHARGTAVGALALSGGFFCTPEISRHFPELAIPTVSTPESAEKRLVDMETSFPGQFVARTTPRVLLFPEIIPQGRSRLEEMREADAFAGLIRQSPGALSDRAALTGQLELLRRLLEQTVSFRLFLTPDVHRKPDALGRLLEELAA